MSKRVDVSHRIPADVERVYAVLTGEGWAAARAEAFHDGSRQESRQVREGGAVELTVSRELPQSVPALFEKLMPAVTRVQQKEFWEPAGDGARRGTWSAHLPGAPATLHGTMALEPVGSETLYTVTGEAKVHLPLVGGKAEGLIVDNLAKLVAKEAELVTELARR